MSDEISMRAKMVAGQFQMLTIEELNWLRGQLLHLLGDDEEGGAGVREPRRPVRPSDTGDGIAISNPEFGI